MPIRGAIAYDDVYINKTKNVFLGKCLSKTYELEMKQDWIGIIVDDEVINRYKDIFNSSELCVIYDALLFHYEVPLKRGVQKKYRTINWRLNLVVEKGTEKLLDITKDEAANLKIRNTLDYARAVRKSGKLY